MTRYAKAPSAHPLGLLLVFGLLLAAMALSASSALALETRLYSGTSLGPEGTTGSATFKALQSVAVEQASGDVYALDGGEGGRLYKFDATGEPVDFSALGDNFIEGVGGSEFGAENEIAIAPPGSPGGTAGDIYVANNSVVKIYSPGGELLGELSGDEEVGHEACGVATDPAGHVFVGFYPNAVREYTPSANPAVNGDKSGQSVASLPGICNVAVDGLGNVYASHYYPGGATAKLEGLTDPSPTLIEPGGPALAIDPTTNELHLDSGGSSSGAGSEIRFYSSSGELKGQYGAADLFNSRGIAIGSSAEGAYVANGGSGKVDVYGPTVILPDVTTEAATAVGATSATLHGTISAAGGPEASCEFQYITEEAFQANVKEHHEAFQSATSSECSPTGPFTGAGSEAVSAPIANLSPGTTYRFRLRAENANGANAGAALSFLTLGPTVAASGVTDITTTAATFTGLINPQGKATTYHFDYGPTASYGSSVPVPDATAGVIPIGAGDVSSGSSGTGIVKNVFMSQGEFVVGQDIVGAAIAPGTTIIKIEGSTLTLSQFAIAVGSGLSFTSTTAAVSQPIKGLAPDTEYHFRLVATNADATYLGPDKQFSTSPVDTGLPDGRAYEMVSPPLKIGEVFPPEPSGILGGSCFECLPGSTDMLMPMQSSPDGEALAFEGQPLSAGLAARENEYISRRSGSGWATQPISPPLAASGAGDESSGFKAFSADLSRGVLFQRKQALSPEAPVSESGEAYKNLYLWEAGSPALRPLVTVEPPNRDPFSFELSFAGGNSGAGGVPALAHLVFEANGALTPPVPTIAPAAPEVGEGNCGGFPAGLFPASDCNLYEWVGGQLRLINVLPGNEAATTHAVIGSGRRLARSLASNGDPRFESENVDHAISADGSRIFWSDGSGQVYVRIDGKETVKIEDPGQFLTASIDGSKVLLSDGCLYSLEEEECEANLTGGPAGFLGTMGASEDLSRIYFLSNEALAAGAQPESCEFSKLKTGSKEEEEGKVPAGLGCNLYAYDHGDVTFVATLFKMDNNSGLNSHLGSWKAARSNRTAQVSPDGRYLAFMSQARLTSYDNRVVGRIACAAKEGREVKGPLACSEVYEYDLEAGRLICPPCNPNGQRPLGGSNLSLIKFNYRQQPFMPLENLPADGEGRLFFESQDTLSVNDTNGHIQDVYEWTPNEVGSCKRAAGCLALISSGHSPNDSMFLNSTPSGNDAFFITREQLAQRDKDDQLDVYDARVGGGFPEDISPPCLGEACKGASSSAPATETPGSSTFSGPSNKKPHKHGKHRKHKSKKHKKAHKRSAQHKKTGGSK